MCCRCVADVADVPADIRVGKKSRKTG